MQTEIDGILRKSSLLSNYMHKKIELSLVDHSVQYVTLIEEGPDFIKVEKGDKTKLINKARISEIIEE
jgi:hypothetical protein